MGVLLNSNTRRGNVILGDKYRTLWGEDYLMDTLCGLEFRLSVPSFYQVNRDQAEVLYGKALEFAGLTGTERWWTCTAARHHHAGAGQASPPCHRRRDRAGGHPGRTGQRPAQRCGERGVFLEETPPMWRRS